MWSWSADVSGGLIGTEKQKKEIDSSVSAEKAGINTIITQNHDAYYQLNNVSAYTDAQPPANTYCSSARLFVDFNFSSIEGNANLDYSQMVYRLQQDTLILIVSNDILNSVIEDLKLNEYDDMIDLTSDDLKWMINKNFMGANIMQLAVSDVDPERAKLIAEKLIEEFIEQSIDFKNIDSVEVLDEASTPQNGMQSSVTPQTISKKKLLKYGIVGCAGGVVFIAVVYLLIFIFKDAVRNALDLAFAEVRLFGTVSKKSRKKEESFKRLALNMSLIDSSKVFTVVPADKKSEDENLIDEMAEELNKLGKKVKVITGDAAESENLIKNIDGAKDKNDIIIVNVRNIKDYSDATLAAVNSDMVLINVTFGKTRMKDLLFAKSELDKTGTKIAGAVIDKARYA